MAKKAKALKKIRYSELPPAEPRFIGKSVDRNFPTVMSPASYEGSGQDEWEGLARTAQVDQEGSEGRLSANLGEVSMNQSFIRGFLDELEKVASRRGRRRRVPPPRFKVDPTLEKAQEALRTTRRYSKYGWKRYGLAGAATGVIEAVKQHPGLVIAPAAFLSGRKLMKMYQEHKSERGR